MLPAECLTECQWPFTSAKAMDRRLISNAFILIVVSYWTSQFAPAHPFKFKEVFSPLKNCHYVIHDLWSTNHSEFSDLTSSLLHDGTPVILTSRQFTTWSAQSVQRIWDGRSQCIAHFIVQFGENAMAEMVAVIGKFGSPASKSEYFLALPVFPASEDNWISLYWQFKKQDAQVGRLMFYIQNWSIVPIQQYENSRGGVTDKAVVVMPFCPEKVVCVELAKTGAYREMEPAETIFESIFPRSGRATRANYNKHSIYVMRTGMTSAFYRIESLLKVPWRDLFSLTGPANQSQSPLARAFFEVASFLNATLKSDKKWADDGVEDDSVPVTAMGFVVTDVQNETWAKEAVTTDSIIFVYCTNETRLTVGSTEQQLFAPFHSSVWLAIAGSVACICTVFKMSKGKSQVFEVLVNLVLQGRIIKGGWLGVLSALWAFICVVLVNFYTSLIESILIAPLGSQLIFSFDQLGDAGYEIIIPAHHPIAYEHNQSYWDEKLPGFEVIPRQGFYTSYDFMAQLFQHKKQATVINHVRVRPYGNAISENLPGMKEIRRQGHSAWVTEFGSILHPTRPLSTLSLLGCMPRGY